MNLKDIFFLGIYLDTCKIWTFRDSDSPFYIKYPFLVFLRKLLLKLSTQSDTIQEIDEITDTFFNLLKNCVESNIKEATIKMKDKLIKMVPIWQDRIERELSNIRVVRLFDGTALNPEKLINGAKSFFSEEIWNLMKGIEKADLDDGCRCISLQAWTPASMITMRAVESVLRSYYQKITGNDPEGKTWGGILGELQNTKSTDKTLIGYLDYLREIRNKLQHPDARFDQFEAEAMFHQAIHIVNILYS